jgi:hypothetical protein
VLDISRVSKFALRALGKILWVRSKNFDFSYRYIPISKAIALNMLRTDMDIATISEVTGLIESVVEKFLTSTVKINVSK